jgi:hypothetical protein
MYQNNGRCSYVHYNRCSVWFPYISTQLSALRRTELRTLSKSPGFILISWQAFCTRCCSTFKFLVGAEYIKVFRCFHSQTSIGLRPGDRTDHLTGPPSPIHCSPKFWFGCSLIMRKKWSCVPSCVNYTCCWWRGTHSKSTGKSLINKSKYSWKN